MKYEYKTQGVCSRQINIDIEDGIVKDVSFVAGCEGSLAGISQLVKGMEADKVAALLLGTKCSSGKATSCPDQLAKAIMQMNKHEA